MSSAASVRLFLCILQFRMCGQWLNKENSLVLTWTLGPRQKHGIGQSAETRAEQDSLG